MSYLIDTDILIDYLRGLPKAIEVIENEAAEASLSVMNVTELYQGIRNEKERLKLASTLSAFTILPITTEIAVQGGVYSAHYRVSHGSGLADCLIAATANEHGLILQTLHAEHYPMLSKVNVPYKK